MTMESAAIFMSASILVTLGFLVIVIGVIIVNNLIVNHLTNIIKLILLNMLYSVNQIFQI